MSSSRPTGAVAPRGAASSTVAGPVPNASLLDWIAVLGGAVGTFMALLDISIVNTALPTIQGEIGASGTEGTWVTTSYIVAESIAVPLTGWLVRMLGMRRLLVWTVILFTAFSMLCGFANSLTMMIIGRTAQGLTGGVLIPMAMMIINDRLPRHQQGLGFAIFGGTAVIGPVLGPLLGGWLTDAMSWHYAFFINLPIGILLVTTMHFSLPRPRANLDELFRGDWFGVVGLVLGVGCLTVVLEEGQREQWIESSQIVWLGIVAALGFVSLAVGQFRAPSPVLNLRLMRDWRVALIMLLGLLGGAAFFGPTFLVPQFLGTVANYTAFEAGKVMMLGALSTLLLLMFFTTLAKLRFGVLIAIGLLTLSFSSWLNAQITPDSGASDFVIAQCLHGIGTTLAMSFLSQLTIALVPSPSRDDASAMFNAARNLGGSFALAAVAILQDQRFALHSGRIKEGLSGNGLLPQDFMAEMTNLLGSADAALRTLDQMISRQALVMTYIDMFYFFAVVLLFTVPLALLLPPMPKGDFGPGGH